MKFLNLFLSILNIFSFGDFCDVSVNIKLGEICGQEEIVNNVNFESFLGIPYAEPPVEELRFHKPKPLIKRYEKPFEAKKPSPACHQVPLFMQIQEPKISEDCLYLNIWRPSFNITSEKDLKPVLIYIHGGGYFVGSGSSINGGKFAAIGDIIVVTINYRLGVFGLLYTDSEDIPGNMALYDQTLAFEWVHENIKYFGGDQKAVTISGTSAGAFSVGHHLSSSFSKNFFQRAILMSGAPMDFLTVENKENSLARSNKLAQIVGCMDESSEIQSIFSKETIKCLQNIDASKLSEIQYSSEIENLTESAFHLFFLPVIDEKFIHKQDLLQEKYNYNSNIPVLIGLMPNEGAVIHYNIAKNTWNYPWIPKNAQTSDDWVEGAKIFLNRLSKLNFDHDAIIKYYFTGLDKTINTPSNMKKFEIVYYQLLSDVLFDCPAMIFTEILTRHESKVFNYVFNYQGTKILQPCPVMQPCHAEDMFHLFDFGIKFPPEVEKVSIEYMKMLANFIHTGNTNWSSSLNIDSKITISPQFDFTGSIDDHEKLPANGLNCQIWKTIIFPDN